MRYSVFAGGKRFRPRLCLATAKALGKPATSVLPIACALELLHTFTLIHDDLPCMDNSDYRRGKLACHKKFDVAIATLAGNTLNTLAFTILVAATKKAQVIIEIGQGLLEVLAGQVEDLAYQGKNISLRKLKQVHQQKTGALLLACVRSVGLECGASPKQLKALSAYARYLGLAFQICDDILDATSIREILGKPVQADKEKGFPHFIGLKKSGELAVAEQQKAIKALAAFGPQADQLRKIAEDVVNRKK